MSKSEKKRVVIGMSGGVDSSVAAALLIQQGYDVVGITLKMWPQDCASIIEDKCCGPQAMADARSVAAHLGIPHYVLDETVDFTKEVIDYFTSEYQAGRTPNPCVLCNERLKFGNLLRKAQGLGAEYVATGHYARVEKTDKGYFLKRATDLRKDQSYFLFTLGQQQLAHTLMPLGSMSKAEVRQLAKDFGLKTHNKDESQDICFVPENDYATFLKTHLGQEQFQHGEVVHRDGRVLGKHQGIELYTIGQRKGINVGYPKPLYVLDIDPERRRVIVGDDDDLWHSSLIAERACWGAEGEVASGAEVLVKIRHSHEGARAKLYPEANGRVKVEFLEPQRAITPGQGTVFYQDDTIIGGGWIAREKFIRPEEVLGGAAKS